MGIEYEEFTHMRAVVTRVSQASVEIEGVITGSIGNGFLVLLGVKNGDTAADAVKLAAKVCNLRVFEDQDGKMNLDLKTAGGGILVISQFTLYADCRSRRPGFTDAARPDTAIPLYELFVGECKKAGFTVETGTFGAMMDVMSVNDGPVTIILDTEQ
jgi:D-tyrosyl-tRNA(Tyr) deacylase